MTLGLARVLLYIALFRDTSGCVKVLFIVTLVLLQVLPASHDWTSLRLIL